MPGQSALSICIEDYNSSLVSATWKCVSRWGELGPHVMVSLANAIIASEKGPCNDHRTGLIQVSELSLSSLALIRDLKAVADTGQAIVHFADTLAQ